MIDAQNPHVRTPTSAALLDVLGRLVVHLHEGHGPRRDTAGTANHIVLGPESRE